MKFIFEGAVSMKMKMIDECENKEKNDIKLCIY